MRSSGLTTDWGTFMPTSVLHDPAEKDPGFRWKMIYWDRIDPRLPPGICLARSPDGIHWTPCRDTPIVTGANDAQSAVLENPQPSRVCTPARSASTSRPGNSIPICRPTGTT